MRSTESNGTSLISKMHLSMYKIKSFEYNVSLQRPVGNDAGGVAGCVQLDVAGQVIRQCRRLRQLQDGGSVVILCRLEVAELRIDLKGSDKRRLQINEFYNYYKIKK